MFNAKDRKKYKKFLFLTFQTILKISPNSEILNENNNPTTVLASSSLGQIISICWKKSILN